MTFQLPWTTEWVPTEGSHTDLYSVKMLLKVVCGATSHSVMWNNLEVDGPDIRSLVTKFKAMLTDAVGSGDFTHILSPGWSFVM